jgi:uroporphyrinogen-III synthase
MHVLITRPIEDSEPFKTRVEELGCRVTLAPLMRIVSNPIPSAPIADATGLIATSRNALTALSASPVMASAAKLPLYVVGPGTAAVARRMGFTTILEGGGTAKDLLPVVRSQGGAVNRLVYLRGDVLAFDLEAALGTEGIQVTPVVAYRSAAAEALPLNVIKALETGDIDAVTLLSPRTAQIWARLAAALPPSVQLGGVTYLCLSERVAEALGQIAKADKVRVASRPQLEEMLALIKRLAASSEAE